MGQVNVIKLQLTVLWKDNTHFLNKDAPKLLKTSDFSLLPTDLPGLGLSTEPAGEKFPSFINML